MTDEPRNYCEMMDFPDTFDEFAKHYGFKDRYKVYTNGSDLISIFRVKQWLEHINKPTTKIEESNFSQKQYKADLQSAYDCGVASVKQEPFINKPCVSTGVCEHDKNVALDKIKAEIEEHCGLAKENHCKYCSYCNNVMGVREILEILDKYMEESEVKKW